jgi:hypothetical protein
MLGFFETLWKDEQERARALPNTGVDSAARAVQAMVAAQNEREDRILEMQAKMQFSAVMAGNPPLALNNLNSRSEPAGIVTYGDIARNDVSVGVDPYYLDPSNYHPAMDAVAAQQQSVGTAMFDPWGAYLPNFPSYGPPTMMTDPFWSRSRQLQLETQTAVEVVEEPSRAMLQRAPVDVENLDLTDPRQKLATDAEAFLGYTPLREELRTPGTLKRVLAQLEMEILDRESVVAYKKQMAAHYETAGKMRQPTWRLTKLKEYKQQVPEFVLQKAVEIKKLLPEAEFYVEQLAVDPFLIVSLAPLSDFVMTDRTLNRAMDPEMSAYVEVWSEPKFEATM